MLEKKERDPCLPGYKCLALDSEKPLFPPCVPKVVCQVREVIFS